MIGNHVLCTWIMIRCPALNVWLMSFIVNSTFVGWPATIGLGVSKLSRKRPRIAFARTSCSNPLRCSPYVMGTASGVSAGYTSINFTIQSESVPLVETQRLAVIGPAIDTSRSSTPEPYTSTSGRCAANRWSSDAYVLVIPLFTSFVYGTGLAGSLTYSSYAAPPAAGGSNESLL